MRSASRDAKTKRKAFVDPGAAQDRDLCHHCENLTICTFARNSGKPVLFCEEYASNYAPEALYAEPVVERNSDTGDNDDASYVGLCATCESVKTCILRKQEGGVWRCNEYR